MKFRGATACFSQSEGNNEHARGSAALLDFISLHKISVSIFHIDDALFGLPGCDLDILIRVWC